MKDFIILNNEKEADPLYGMERKIITIEDIEALKDGKLLYTDIAEEYALLIGIDEVPTVRHIHDNLHPKTDHNFMSCSDCIHAEDSEEICVLRKCVHAISELKECYIERGKSKWKLQY